MKKALTYANISIHLNETLNLVLPNHIPELKFCIENNKSFKKWFSNKFCKYTQKVDSQDLCLLVESINGCLKDLDLNLEAVEFVEKQRKEIEDFVDKVRFEKVKPFCEKKNYDFISGMGDWFFMDSDGETIENDSLNHSHLIELLSFEIDTRFQIGEYMESYYSENGYRKSIVEPKTDFKNKGK